MTQTSSPFSSRIGSAVFRPDVDRHAETRGLDLATPHRAGGIAEHEAGDDIGAAGDRGEVHVFLDIAVDVIEAFGGERRAGGGDEPHRRQVMGLGGLEARLLAGVDIFRRGAEHVDVLSLREIPHHRLRRERRAVVEHERRARGDAGGEPVPHHPAAGGEVEQPLAVAQVALQAVLLHVLQQRAAGAVHDAFRHAGGAGGEQDIDGMIERQPLEGERLRRERLEERCKRLRARHACRHGIRLAEIGHDHDLAGRRQLAGDRLQLVGDFDLLAVVPVAVDGHEYLGLDLPEAVEHAALAEVGRARREDGAERGDRQHQRDGFRQVGQHGGDAVALSHARRGKRLLQARDQRVEFVPGEPGGDLVLAAEDHGVAAAGRLQQVFREIDFGVGKKLRPGHAVAVDQPALALVADHPVDVPDEVPERAALADRPVMQVAVVLQRQAVALVGRGDEGGDVAGGDTVRARAPQRLLRGFHC